MRFLTSLYIGIWIAKYLGPESYGVFSYVLLFISVFHGISNLGLNGILVKEFIENIEKQKIYVVTSICLNILGGVISLACIYVILIILNTDDAVKDLILILSLSLILQSFNVIEYFYIAGVKAKVVSICKIIQITISSIFSKMK